MNNPVKEKYKQLYQDLGFERAGLFQLVQKEFGCKSVLYPGCSIHITPSFYFSHLVYIDKSDTAASFFAHHELVIALVNENKNYKQPAYIKFIAADFEHDLPIRENSYDLLISLFGGSMAAAGAKYVKPGG
jgi:hypothetical protein